MNKNTVSSIRELMKQHKVDAYIIPSTDPHGSEYVASHWQSRAWISGFTGSAGTAVITQDHAGVWTDSRYFLQAETELSNSDFELHKLTIPHTDEHIDWLLQALSTGAKVAVAGSVVSYGVFGNWSEIFANKGFTLVSEHDFIAEVWLDRPEIPRNIVFEQPLEFAGFSRKQKLDRVRNLMAEMQPDYMLFTSLDEIAWLTNLRGSDIDYNPLFISYLVVEKEQAVLFTDSSKVSDDLRNELASEGIKLQNYNEIIKYIASIAAGEVLVYDHAKVNCMITDSVNEGVLVKNESSPVTLLKAMKTSHEAGHIRKTMEYDGVAMVRFLKWLEETLGKEKVTELSAAEKLREFRAESEHFLGESFNTIAGYKGHGAIVHYGASPETDAVLGKEGIFLLDSGGQYFGGTTDLTRTIALGEPTDTQKLHYTLVLQGHIDLAMAKFPYGTKGFQLDMLARAPLWQHGLNYGHGTGHGVGYCLNVHEGPQNIGPRAVQQPIEVGMLTSNEPGLYIENEYGIRIENLVLAVDAGETESGKFIEFETVTLCPIQTKLMDAKILSREQKEWLNTYHSAVYNKLLPYLNSGEQKWLKEQTKEV